MDNGATVVTRYIPASPLVTIQIRVLSGLSNEGEYAGSGISHFLEHLLFKGTRDKGAEVIRKEIKAMGGIANGSTGLDSAEYHITVPKENFEKALPLLTSMVMELVFTDEEMEREREVVLKEIRRNNDEPSKKRMRLLFAQAYREHVYKHPIIGYESRLKALKRDDLLRYHGAVYKPERTVIGVAGGVSPEVVLEAVESEFKKYERGDVWQVSVASEPRQLDERVSMFPEEVLLGYIAIGFHTTDLYSPDLYAGDVLSILVGEGSDSRLYKRLVKEKELLYSVSSLNYTPKYPGLFVIAGIGEPDKLDKARDEIFTVLNELKLGRIEKGEIERAKNMVISNYLRSQESVKSITASITSSQAMTGDPVFYDKYVDEVRKVGKWQIKNAALQYLTTDNSTTVILLPRRQYQKEISKEEREEKKEVKEAEKTGKLENGLRFIVKKRSKLPLVSVSLTMPGGLRAENEDTSGLSNFTASTMLKGTKRRKERQIVPAMERMGGGVKAFSGVNGMGLAMSMMSGDFDEGMDIFEDVVKNPVFPEEELAKQKKKILAAIREEEKDIFDKGLLEFRSELYGKHPYSMRVLGKIGTMKKFTRNDIVKFKQEYWGPKNAVMAVVGDVDVEGTVEAITKRFRDWEGEVKTIEPQKVVPLNEPRREDISMRREQSLFLLGFLGAEVTDSRRYTLSVISSLLSGSDGLLFYALREKRGLTYTSGAVSIPAVDPGYFLIYVATTEENIEDVRKKVVFLLKKITEGNISDEEIEAAKNRLITQHASSLETNSSLSMTMSMSELYGLGYDNYKLYPDRIRAVTKNDIREVAKQVLNLDSSAEVIIHSSK
ncbi:MAG: M16 family metallopeptidase [Candidatus Omnitrophota bacterium]